VHALADVDFAVNRGELVAVVGPSGSGKSTLLLVLAGLERPDSGSVRIGGTVLGELGSKQLYAFRRRTIGMVFQNYNLVPTLTAVENVMLADELDGVAHRKAREAALKALVEVGLHGLDGRFPHQLSGGQQQRVALARALSGTRQVLLADEPTGALDSATANEVLDTIVERVAAGAAGVIVTHDDAVASRADRVVRIVDGAVQAEDR
jgi:putative ABC transport system ATP-binding protein